MSYYTRIQLVRCTQGNCGESDYKKLIDSIDRAIYKNAKLEYNNLRFYLKKKLNCKDDYELLSYYRDILLRKINNDECLYYVDINRIISRIKKLLR